MDRFLVESDRRAIGVAIRVAGGYQFFCSDPEFRSMDSKVFPRARALTTGVEQLARARRARPNTTLPV